MYCPSCGIEYSQKLRYCKNCGQSLGVPASTSESKPPRLKVTGMFWAIAVFGMGGLGLAFSALIAMAKLGMHGDELIVPFIFSLVMISAIAGLLVWQLSRLISA